MARNSCSWNASRNVRIKPKEAILLLVWPRQEIVGQPKRAGESDLADLTAISPDGRYLATVIGRADGTQSLWVRHISTSSEQPILQDAAFQYLDLTFSPDGS